MATTPQSINKEEATPSSIPSPLAYLRPLTEDIGPRGSTTPQEAAAADYALRTLQELGLQRARLERFLSARSAWRPYAVVCGMAVLAGLIYPWGGWITGLVATLLMASAMLCALAELNYQDNPIRRLLPKGPSQNVIGVVPSRLVPQQKVVLVGHLDTHRTPFLFQSHAGLVLFAGMVILGFVGGALNIVLFGLGALTGWDWIYPATLVPTVMLGLSGLACLQADATPYTVGANDNASGVGVALHLAHLLREQPLLQTEVWVLLSGCEEVGCYGMLDFLQRHGESLQDAYFINFESVGVGNLHYASREGMTFPYFSDSTLLEVAGQVAGRHPDWKVEPRALAAGYTETGLVIQRGFRGITLVALDEAGLLPYWHQPEDTLENLEPEALERAALFAWEMMRELDRRV